MTTQISHERHRFVCITWFDTDGGKCIFFCYCCYSKKNGNIKSTYIHIQDYIVHFKPKLMRHRFGIYYSWYFEKNADLAIEISSIYSDNQWNNKSMSSNFVEWTGSSRNINILYTRDAYDDLSGCLSICGWQFFTWLDKRWRKIHNLIKFWVLIDWIEIMVYVLFFLQFRVYFCVHLKFNATLIYEKPFGMKIMERRTLSIFSKFQ